MHISGLGLPLMRCCCLRSDASPNRVCVCKQKLSPTCGKKNKPKRKRKRKNKKIATPCSQPNPKKKKKKKEYRRCLRTMLPLGDLPVVLTSPLVFRRNGLWHSALAVLAPSTIVTLHFRVISPSVSVVIVARLPPSVVPCGAQPLLSARPCHGYILALLPFCTCTFALLPCTFALLHLHFCFSLLH